MNGEITETIILVSSVIAAITGSFMLFLEILSYYLAKKAKKIKISIYSSLVKSDDKILASIKIYNLSQRIVFIESVRFPLSIYCKKEKLRISHVLRPIRFFLSSNTDEFYVSDLAIYSKKEFPVKLEANEPIDFDINLNHMMEEYIKSNETIIKKIYYRLMTLFLRIEVRTSDGSVFKRRANFDISRYLWNKYKNDERLYRL